MIDIEAHCINRKAPIMEALQKMNAIPENLTLFITGTDHSLVGTLTDGDIRRGFMNGNRLSDSVEKFMKGSFHFLSTRELKPEEISVIKQKGVKLLPVIDGKGKIIRVIDLKKTITILPVDAVIMAGGRGERLRPLTDTTPKPLLKLGSKPILEHNIDHLVKYGIEHFFITLNYLGEQIESYFGNGESKEIRIKYTREKQTLGTIGSVSLIKELRHSHVLIMNADVFTNIDLENFYRNFIDEEADMAIATIPYVVDVPYAVLNIENNRLSSFREKPSYTYSSNAGIYLIRRDLLELIPIEKQFNATDFIQALLSHGKKVIRFPIIGYWVDIGKPEDYQKAREMVTYLTSSAI